MGNKTSEYTLLKSRSIGGVVRAGMKLYTENMKTIFKLSWPEAIAFAAINSVLGVSLSIYMHEITARLFTGVENYINTMTHFGLLFCVLFLVAIVGGIFEIMFYSRGIYALREHSGNDSISVPGKWLTFDRQITWRTLKAAFFVMIPSLVVAFITILAEYGIVHLCTGVAHLSPGSIVMKAACLLPPIVAAVVMLPFCHIAMKYIMNDEYHFISLTTNEYSTSMRHMPYILAVNFVGLLEVIIAGLIISLPAYIISKACAAAYTGHYKGDPLGMPEYITWLTAATCFVTGFLTAYVRMPLIFMVYYMYGSIESHENGRRRMKETMKETA